MGVKFCVLGSGSTGNAALVRAPGADILIDAGFSPEELGARLRGTGASWDSIRALVLTHTHGDHLKRRSLREAFTRKIPFYCHAEHLVQLEPIKYLKRALEAGLVHPYVAGQPFEIAQELLFHPVEVPHDAPPTFGFRIETADADGRARRIGYFADLGHYTPDIAAAMLEVDLLALEFNHDEELERNSGRHPRLIERVLGAHGHLSNRQAALVFEQVLQACPRGGPRQLVQLHLSRDCNSPELAYHAAREVVQRQGRETQIFSSRQEQRGSVLAV